MPSLLSECGISTRTSTLKKRLKEPRMKLKKNAKNKKPKESQIIMLNGRLREKCKENPSPMTFLWNGEPPLSASL
jgi:hypothetical protein